MNITTGYFDGVDIPIMEDLSETGKGPDAALASFQKLTQEDRMADSHHVYAYYRDFHQAVGGEDWLDEEMGIPAIPEDIWKYVKAGSISVEKGRDADTDYYVVMVAKCDWEEEHGLMLVWRNGTQLTKVGGFDGHISNVNAYANAKLADVVYSATNPQYTTYLKQP
ncbi:hypothetical protein GCM10007939_13940 [Amylibacter marinus]|uniref:DUF6985 domain-containing protein n=1 Tax=Amylibacter marinus TaxID=1475483 RepID=A0ABQ5VV26_9RHOB|nr:hypothetical protein [Amylibacter marinus]GLQ35111.1 hypothetical protein GCM10007939_13940 [Amylibacter marinus]